FGQAKDWLLAKLGRTTSDDDKLDALVWTLDDRLAVKVTADYGGEGTVAISIDWPDPRMAYRLVAAAQESFIEARLLSETASISEAAAINTARAATLREEMDVTARAIEKHKAELLVVDHKPDRKLRATAFEHRGP